MDAFNALPKEQRTAMTDGALGRQPPQRISIPVVAIAPASTDLRQVTLVFDAAEAVGAFDRLKTKVEVDSDWFELSTIERARRSEFQHGGHRHRPGGRLAPDAARRTHYATAET